MSMNRRGDLLVTPAQTIYFLILNFGILLLFLSKLIYKPVLQRLSLQGNFNIDVAIFQVEGNHTFSCAFLLIVNNPSNTIHISE